MVQPRKASVCENQCWLESSDFDDKKCLKKHKASSTKKRLRKCVTSRGLRILTQEQVGVLEVVQVRTGDIKEKRTTYVKLR